MPKIAIIFPGQGSQYVGMGKQLYRQFSIVQNTFKEANDILGYDLKKLCFEGPFNELSKIENIQPAILTASVAAFKVFMNEIGLKPDLMTGHSFGELSALVCAEAISLETALQITKIKAKAINETISHRPTAMAAVENVDLKLVEEICKSISQKKRTVVIAAVNSSRQTVISGDKALVRKAGALLANKGGKTEELFIGAAFHSPILNDAAKKVKTKIKKFRYSPLKYLVYSGITLRPYENTRDIIDNISWQLCKPILWRSLVNILYKKGIRATIEIGPRTMLIDFIKKINKQKKFFSFNKINDLEFLKKEFCLNKEYKFDFIINCLRAAACTKNNNLNENDHKMGVVEPYNEINKLLLALEEKNLEPSNDNLSAALKMFNTVLAAKKTPAKETNDRYKELFYSRNGSYFPYLEKIIK
ncbi:MAG: acyltransferase [Parcubacteria group bacterium GW2011_GWA2_42_11]|nr:MAG: acyltransferase [Parcubacteria group bacterium GW2011_GWA2_42_11]